MKSFSILLPAATLLSVALQASAHGFLASVSIAGKVYNGPKPGLSASASANSAIRGVSTPEPNKGASNPALTCGPNAVKAGDVASAMPGDKLEFSWKGDDLSNWPHNTGPMLTYMASCGGSCEDFDASKAKWFKIDQDGRKSGSPTWVQQDLMNGATAKSALPASLAPGNYLIRHEIIALHLATSPGGAEFYPGCIQVSVGGSQSGKPTNSELVSLPGAYSDNDPGIFDPDVFDASKTYVFPGPKVAAFVTGAAAAGGSSSPAPSGGSTPSNGGSNTGSNGTTSNATPPKKTCKLKKREPEALLKVREARPFHVSRVMRRIAFGQSTR